MARLEMAVLLAALAVLAAPACATGGWRERVRAVCERSPHDGHSRQSPAMLAAELERMGEKGRRGLLSLAASEDVNAPCALDFLGAFREPRALPVARRILADTAAPDLKRAAAMWVVARLKDVESLDALLGAFHLMRTSYDKDFVAMAAASALLEMGNDRGVTAVIDALDDPAYRRATQDLVRILGRRGNDRAVEPLLHLLERPEAESLRLGVARSLINIGTPRSRRAGMEAFDAIADSRIRAYGKGELINALWVQRRDAKTPEEVAEIDGCLDHLGAQRPSLPEAQQNESP